MAEPLSRSQIILQQIESLKGAAPAPLSQAERDQIMKGRKGQKDIDAGRAAIDARARELADHTKALDALYSKLESAGQQEGGEKKAADAEARRVERERNANPLLNTIVPAASGAAVGAGIGEVENRILHAFNKGSANALIEASDELGPVEKLTNSQINRARATGMASAMEKYAPSNPLRQAGAVAGRGLSYGIPAAAFYNEYQKYHGRAEDPGATEADKLSNQQVANALLGASTGIAADGGMRFFFPSRHEGEGKAISRGYAAKDFVRRLDAADAARNAPRPTPATRVPPGDGGTALPAPKRHLPGSTGDLKAQAKKYGVPGRSTMNAAELRDAVGEAVKTAKAPRGGAATKMIKGLGPLTAGFVAGDAAFNDARAAGGDVGSSIASAAPTAAVAAGLTAGTGYAVNKILGAAAPMMGLLSPFAAADITDNFDQTTPEKRDAYQQRVYNSAMIEPAFLRQFDWEASEMYDKAQLPSRNPERGDEFATARSLEVPEMPQGAPQEPEPMDYDAQLADLQRIFAELDAHDNPEPVQVAAQSAQVAQMPQQWQAPPMPTNRLLAGR